MSIYAQFDEDGPCLQLASNVGWSEFGDWVETIKGYSIITDLFNNGNTENIKGLRDELEDVLEKNPPESKDVLSVADGIIHSIDSAGDAEIMMITFGMKNVTPESTAKKPANGKHLAKIPHRG